MKFHREKYKDSITLFYIYDRKYILSDEWPEERTTGSSIKYIVR